jgi:DNA-binding transcriptional regulator WhiA
MPKNQNITVPDVNTVEFAEFFGTMLGDGCVYSNLSGIVISGDSILDREYFEKYLMPLIKNLFGICPRIYYHKNQQSIRIVLYSKEIAKFFAILSFPVGPKKKKLFFLPKFFQEAKLMKACLRGYFDTDGTIYGHPGARSIVEISITDKNFSKRVAKEINALGGNVKVSTNRVYLSGKRKTIDFFNIFLPVNQRHTIKYKFLLENKPIPKSKEIEIFLSL